MRVEIGPVGTTTAVAWIRYGRYVVDHLSSGGAAPLSEHVLEWFSELLDEFDRIASEAAAADREFDWIEDRTPEEVEFVMKGLFEVGLAVEREHDAGRMFLRPADADEFHVTIVQQILGQIELEGPAYAQFVEGLRAEWGIAGNP